LPDGVSYVAAGFNKDGICDRIRADMKRLFPNETPGDLDGEAPGVTAFAFLKAGLEFDVPYQINPHPLKFKNRDGSQTAVRSTGFLVNAPATAPLRAQLKILHYQEQPRSRVPLSFALDLCANSKPNQLILAVIDWRPTLQEALADLD